MKDIVIAVIGSGVLAAFISGCFSRWNTKYNHRANIKNKNRVDMVDHIAKLFAEILSESYSLNDIEGYMDPVTIMSYLKNMRINLINIKILLYDDENNEDLLHSIKNASKLVSQTIKNTYKESEIQEGLVSAEYVIDPELHTSLIELEEDISKYILNQRKNAEDNK